MSERKKLTTMKVIEIMSKIEKGWPKGLSLFIDGAGTLMLIDEQDRRRIVWTFDGIRADGGDENVITAADGYEYLGTKDGGE